MAAPLPLEDQFGNIDIYVFDQILRGNIAPGMRLLDAGCGYGRNLVYLLRQGYDIFALDANPEAIASLRETAAQLAPALPGANFQVGVIETMPYPDSLADVVLCSSVLHFARDDAHFHSMVRELWRVLRPGGLLFCRLGSTIGMDFDPLTRAGSTRHFRIGDGSEWYLVDEAMLMNLTATLGAELLDPLKTTVVQNHRCMTTWVVRKALA